MPNEFISKSISSRIIIIENDSFECKSYRINLVENNNKNNLYYTIRFVDINKLEILSSCIYININKFR